MTVTENKPAASATGTAVEHVLTLDCAESPGIVHAVSGFLVEHGCDIIDNKQFGDRRTGRFYMRVHVTSTAGGGTAGPSDGGGAVPPTSDADAPASDAVADEWTAQLRAAFEPIAERYGMRWNLDRHGRKRRVLIMVSKFGHCLNDLLFRARSGELPIDIVAVVSNHLDHKALVDWHGIPYFHLPVTPDTKADAESRLLELIDEKDVELIVLARYMQVLSDELSARLSGRCINIHHSFLPSFKGAKPYHQAYERGVKTVGATAHYVDAELDEGPIIAQQVIDVDHTYGPEDLVAAGRDTECRALTNAVRWHCEGRVILSGGRTVILR